MITKVDTDHKILKTGTYNEFGTIVFLAIFYTIEEGGWKKNMIDTKIQTKMSIFDFSTM